MMGSRAQTPALPLRSFDDLRPCCGLGDIAMRVFAAVFAALSLAFASAVPAVAQQETPPPVKGLFLLTDYPAVTVQPLDLHHQPAAANTRCPPRA